MPRPTKVRRRKRRPRVGDVVESLESVAAPALAAEWDNVGLLIGDRSSPVSRVLLTIDLTGPVLQEALNAGAEMVMAYHPVIFKPIERLTAEATPVAYAAARAGLAVYSTHTALDAAPGGTNDVLAEAIGLTHTSALEPALRQDNCKVVVFLPPADLPRVSVAAFDAGAGQIGDYAECSFRTSGTGSFRCGARARSARGRTGRSKQIEELRLEVSVPRSRLTEVVAAIRAAHSYQTPAVDVYALDALPEGAGMGRIGRLPRPTAPRTLVARIKRALDVRRILVAGTRTDPVTTVACCAGSCGSMFRAAVAGGADMYVTGEMRHHDALAAAEGMMVLCVGHSNSERITLSRLAGRLRTDLPGLQVKLSRADRDPFQIV